MHSEETPSLIFSLLGFISSFLPLMLEGILGLSVPWLASAGAVDWYSEEMIAGVSTNEWKIMPCLLYLQHFSILL